MAPAAADGEIRIAVPQHYKDFVVQRQYRWFWYILAAALGGVNAAYYLLCLALHWKWRFHFQGDMVVPIIGLFVYTWEVRKSWYYEINERRIKLIVVASKTTQLAKLEELEWKKTQVLGTEPDEWQGLICLKLKVSPDVGTRYQLVYSPAEAEVIITKVVPLIEKYRHQYRQELWADKLRS